MYNKTFKKLIVLLQVIVTISLGYIAFTFSFSSLLINFILIIISLYSFLQALENVDEINGYNTENPKSNKHTGLLDNNGFPDNNDDDIIEDNSN